MTAKEEELILQRIVEKVEENNLMALRLVVEQVSLEDRTRIVAKSFWNETPLHTACRQNLVAISEFLISNCGANVNQVYERDNVLSTPLFIAVEHGGPTLVKTLIRLGANIHWTNHIGQNALVYACKSNLIPVARVLLENRAQINSDANMKNCLESIAYYKRSLTFGTDINWFNEEGNNLFIESCRTNNLALMDLLRNRIDPYHRNEEGANALDVAILYANEITVKNLTAKVYKKSDEVLSYEYCGARTIVSSSNLQMAKNLWLKSVKLRQDHSCCIKAKTPFVSEEMPFQIKEFVNEEDIKGLNKEDLALQALLVYLRILTPQCPATHRAFSSVALSEYFTMTLKKSFMLAKRLFSLPRPKHKLTACPAAMAMFALIKLYYTHVDIARQNYWTTVAVFINLVDFLIDNVWQLLSKTISNRKYFVLYKELLNMVLKYLNIIMEIGMVDEVIDGRMECLVSKFSQHYPTSLLHIALSRKCIFKVVVYLLKCKSALDIKDNEENMPIHLALTRYPETDEKYKIAVSLICAGSNIDTPNGSGLIPRELFLSMK